MSCLGDELSVNELSVDELSVDELSVDELSVIELSVDELSVNELLVDELSPHPFLRILFTKYKIWSYLINSQFDQLSKIISDEIGLHTYLYEMIIFDSISPMRCLMKAWLD